MWDRKKTSLAVLIVTLSGCASLNAPCPPETLATLLEGELPESTEVVPPIVEEDLVFAVHQRVNGIRREHGLQPLAWEPRLAVVAQQHSQDMADRGFFSHVNPDGLDPSDRARERGLLHTRVSDNLIAEGIGENIYLAHRYSEYRTYRDPDGRVRCEFDWLTVDQIAVHAVDTWAQSRTHRANMLSSVYLGHGIGVAAGPNGTVFLTQNLSPTKSGSGLAALLD
jgi:uncharacterized protein YkwD